MTEFIDTHQHVHFPDYELDVDEVIRTAIDDGVTRMICVGCTLADSKLGVEMAARHKSIWASVGVHPHEARFYVENEKALQELRDLVQNNARPSGLSAGQGEGEQRTETYSKYDEGVAEPSTPTSTKSSGSAFGSAKSQDATSRKVVAVGEVGLDYYYNHSEPEEQKALFRYQLELAQEHDLPVIFHVREAQQQDKSAKGQAFDDFFAIFDEFTDIRGVVHSFTASSSALDKCLSRGLYIGLNGIMTFTKDKKQLEMAKKVPLDRLLLETDAPFLTPVPFRGTICQPKHVVSTAQFLANLRQESLEELAAATTQNALTLFRL